MRGLGGRMKSGHGSACAIGVCWVSLVYVHAAFITEKPGGSWFLAGFCCVPTHHPPAPPPCPFLAAGPVLAVCRGRGAGLQWCSRNHSLPA